VLERGLQGLGVEAVRLRDRALLSAASRIGWGREALA
jgi:hypothetical protein